MGSEFVRLRGQRGGEQINEDWGFAQKVLMISLKLFPFH